MFKIDGLEFPTAAKVVEYMRGTSFTETSSTAAFLVATAARTAEQFGTDIRSDTAEHFVADLVKVGLVEQI